MRLYLTVLSLILVTSLHAESFKQYVSPTVKNRDFVCINYNSSSETYGYMAHGKFFFCPELTWAGDANYECASIKVFDDKGVMETSFIITKAVYFADEDLKTKFFSVLDQNFEFYFDYRYGFVQREISELTVNKTSYPDDPNWAPARLTYYLGEDDTVTSFNVDCKFTNKHPLVQDENSSELPPGLFDSNENSPW